ncbi:MAG TPA: sodium/glutamate symporter [Candidatus Acidoferrum sp.]|nr:sodium/glutamate symporter [Candidatus Acidoferrum sp.]
MVPTLKLTSVQLLGLAGLGAAAGVWIKHRVPVLDRLNVPAPIVGGMLYALLALALRDRFVNLDADTSLRDLFQIAFFTTIGLSVRVEALRRGGSALLWLLAAASAGAVMQNLLGIGLAKALGLDPRIGILAGSVSLAGGPATSLAFGSTFEQMGLRGATTIAIAAATFGITVSGLIGGYIGGRLIERRKLRSTGTAPAAVVAQDASAASLMNVCIVIAIAMGLGSLVSLGVQRAGVILPAYIGAMAVAAVLRNLDDRYRFARIGQFEVDEIGRVALHLFIVMALVTLRLWELAHLAGPMLIILIAQVALVWLMCVMLAFRVMGRDYDAAVGAAGFCGFMLGITANAVAVMEELVEKYGPAPRAFLVVPVVGAFLIDFTNSLIITAMANF